MFNLTLTSPLRQTSLGPAERRELLGVLAESSPIQTREHRDRTLRLSLGGTLVSFFHYPCLQWKKVYNTTRPHQSLGHLA